MYVKWLAFILKGQRAHGYVILFSVLCFEFFDSKVNPGFSYMTAYRTALKSEGKNLSSVMTKCLQYDF